MNGVNHQYPEKTLLSFSLIFLVLKGVCCVVVCGGGGRGAGESQASHRAGDNSLAKKSSTSGLMTGAA